MQPLQQEDQKLVNFLLNINNKDYDKFIYLTSFYLIRATR